VLIENIHVEEVPHCLEKIVILPQKKCSLKYKLIKIPPNVT